MSIAQFVLPLVRHLGVSNLGKYQHIWIDSKNVEMVIRKDNCSFVNCLLVKHTHTSSKEQASRMNRCSNRFRFHHRLGFEHVSFLAVSLSSCIVCRRVIWFYHDHHPLLLCAQMRLRVLAPELLAKTQNVNCYWFLYPNHNLFATSSYFGWIIYKIQMRKC